MTTEPASHNPYASLTIGQLIGMNLARLYTWLIGLHNSGETRAPHDIAQMVASTDAMVHAYIRALASQQLERTGFIFAALAMRDPICSREPAAHIERAQGCPTATPAELLTRLETTIDTFERAEALASALARVIVFALIYVSPHTSSHSFSARNSIRPDVGRSACRAALSTFYARLASRELKRAAVSVASWREIKQPVSPPTPEPVGRGPPYQWPPPFLDPGSSPGTAGEIAHDPFISIPGAPDQIRGIRDPGSQNNRCQFGASEPDRATGDSPPHSPEPVLCEARLARTKIGEP